MSYLANVSKIASKSLHTYTNRHAKRQANRQPLQLFTFPHFQKYISILTISVSDFPEVRQKHANKCLLLTCSGWKSARREHQQQRSKADKREEHTTRGLTQTLRQVLKPQRARSPAPPAPTFQINVCFSHLSVSQNPEKTLRHTKEKFIFSLF